LIDRRRGGEDLTDDKLSDLKRHEEDEKARLKAANLFDPKAGEESTSLIGEDSVSLKEVVMLSKTSQVPSPPSPNDNAFPSQPSNDNEDPDYEKECNDLFDRRDAGEEVDEDRLD
jgi:hypothetical protein